MSMLCVRRRAHALGSAALCALTRATTSRHVCACMAAGRRRLHAAAGTGSYSPSTPNYATVPKQMCDYLFNGKHIAAADGPPWALHRWPKLQVDGGEGTDILTHLTAYAQRVRRPYYELLRDAARSFTVPPLPSSFSLAQGWTRYCADGIGSRVDYPAESLLFLDVETCPTVSHKAVLAVALANDAWYSWCSDDLSNAPSEPAASGFQTEYAHDDFISLGESASARLVIGHHVAFDRARLRQPYNLKPDGLRFWDTMSMHVAVCGMTSDQIGDYKRFEKKPTSTPSRRWLAHWFDRTCPNNLKDVHKFHCGKGDNFVLDKSERDMFVKGTVDDIRANFQKAAAYCARDVLATAEVFRALWPKFDAKFAHPITHWGMLELGTSYLPLTDIWRQYNKIGDKTAGNLRGQLEAVVASAAGDAVRHFGAGAKASPVRANTQDWTSDAWLWWLNWRARKWPPQLVEQCEWIERLKSDVNDELAPWWLIALFKRADATKDYETVIGSSCIPALLRMSWHGAPLVYLHPQKWGFLRVFTTSNQPGTFHLDDVQSSDLDWSPIGHGAMSELDQASTWNIMRAVLREQKPVDAMLESTSRKEITLAACNERRAPHTQVRLVFCPLPHPLARSRGVWSKSGVGSPLTLHWLEHVDSGAMSSRPAQLAADYAHASRHLKYWTQIEERLRQQVVFWDADCDRGALLPQLIVCGTVTRRVVERLWMTVSNPHRQRSGSELKSIVQAPTGYKFVGADVDSQEQWLAALFGDSYKAGVRPLGHAHGRADRSQGQTGFSQMLLSGARAAGTDLHSRVAHMLSVSRHDAKVFNYARLYGAGQGYSTSLMKTSISENRNLTAEQREQAIAKAEHDIRDMYAKTKGTKSQYAVLHGVGGELFQQFFARYKRFAHMCHIGQDGAVWVMARRTHYRRAPRTAIWTSFLKWMRVNHPTVALKECVDGAEPHSTTNHSGECDSVHFALRTRWMGGFESETFNCLEDLGIWKAEPRTPVLHAALSDALTLPQCAIAYDDFVGARGRSRINWVVQSSGVDFLHIFLTAMHWLCTEYDMDARYAISIHDEIRYLVSDGDSERFALAMHLGNMFTRAAVCAALDMTDSLPMSVAFFSKVQMDSVLRKDPTDDAVTPSNPNGLRRQYNVRPGAALDIYAAFDATGGRLDRCGDGAEGACLDDAQNATTALEEAESDFDATVSGDFDSMSDIEDDVATAYSVIDKKMVAV